MKINISLDEELVHRIDNYSDTNYMSRSGLISLACTQYLNSADVILAVKNLSLAMQKIADTGNVDKDTIKDLEDYQRLANMLIAGK